MLVLLGVLTIVALLAAILFNRMSPVVALILIPVAAALIGGFGASTANFMIHGITEIAPVAGMFVFAILFFGVMTDAGLLEPLLRGIIRLAGSRPALIVPASALLALLVHLDGSGAVCFLVVIPAMLPLYDRLGMDRRVLACATSLAAGVNVLPWTGPTLRSSAALKIPVMDIFRPMIGVQVAGLIFVFTACFWLGRREEKRLAARGPLSTLATATIKDTSEQANLQRPRLFWVNLALTIAVLGGMIFSTIPPVVLFMTGTALALLINYPDAAQQRARVDAHAGAALLMASVLFAAGIFTGIMTGSGMLQAMAAAAVGAVPPGAGHHIPFALSLVAMPLSLAFDPDSFYFGVLPILAHTVQSLGGTALQTAQAALIGQMTTGFPVSPLTPATFLVAGLCRLELGAHQRFTFPFLYAASLVMAVAAVGFRLFPV
ncbi:MAG TPA: citrate:proton symporter [Rhizomicrobium sp.]|jgi:CitMHS family citrate-Mg2+:H+ or citrate-Ca2+:H+ symporter|nr:citrate:proton symporter [Rhizomicrobium sp.]